MGCCCCCCLHIKSHPFYPTTSSRVLRVCTDSSILERDEIPWSQATYTYHQIAEYTRYRKIQNTTRKRESKNKKKENEIKARERRKERTVKRGNKGETKEKKDNDGNFFQFIDV